LYARYHAVFQNAQTNFAMAISYKRKMFMKLTPGVEEVSGL